MFQKLFLQFWWVTAFLLFCLFLYEQGSKARESEFRQLREQLMALEIKKREALKLQRGLQLQVNSQSDVAWIEPTLMRGLGVCPEGQQKVYFYKDDP